MAGRETSASVKSSRWSGSETASTSVKLVRKGFVVSDEAKRRAFRGLFVVNLSIGIEN